MPAPGHTIETKTLQIAGGISKQPPHERFPGQLEDANNATFAIVDGASRRPGSIFIKRIAGLTTGNGSVYRLHPINRSGTEKYLLVYAIDILRVFHIDGTESLVHGLNAYGYAVGNQAADYYSKNNATADQLRFISVADYTIIANTTVPLGVSATPSYIVTAEWPTYEQMVAHTPTSLPGSSTIYLAGDLTYHRTNNDSAAEPAGYYLYSVSGNTFPTIQFATIGGPSSGGLPSDWADNTPRGFKIRFEKRQDTFTGGTWRNVNTTRSITGISNTSPPVVTTTAAHGYVDGEQVTFSGTGVTALNTGNYYVKATTFIATTFGVYSDPALTIPVAASGVGGAAGTALCKGKTLTAGTLFGGVFTGAWKGYAIQAGDNGYISAGTGWTPAWYAINSHPSANSIGLTNLDGSAINVAISSDVAGSGIGQEYRVQFSGTGGTMPTMHDVAQFIQTKLQSAGAIDALVEWTDTGNDGSGFSYGYFTITGPWRGSGSKITNVTPNPSPPGGIIVAGSVGDQSRVGGPLNPTGAILTDGGGFGPRTLPFNQRWTRVAAPGDSDGVIDKTKSPIKLIRQTPAGAGSISGMSLTGTPTTVTTSAPHGLTTEQTVTIAGTATTPGSTLGAFAVVVTSATTFTITANVTGGSTTGTYTSNAYFTYDYIGWNSRTSGTDATNPSPAIFKNGLTIADMGFVEQRLVIAAGEHIQTSAASDLFRFYLDNAHNLVSSDPIDAPLSSDRVTFIDRVCRVRDTLYVTTFAGVQHALASNGPLTPSSVTFPRATTLLTLRTAPVVLDPMVYIPASSGGKSQLREAFFVDQSVPTDAADVSSHVSGTAVDAGLLPANIQTLTAHSNSRTIVMLPAPGANTLYLYKSFWFGPRKEQSAWSVWTFNAGTRISDAMVIDDFLYLVVEHNDGATAQFSLEKIPMYEPSAGNYPYTLHIDRQIPLAAGTGSFGGGVTTWTLPDGLSDTTINTGVCASGGAFASGTPFAVTGLGTTCTAIGNYSTTPVTIGRSYQFSIQLTEPYPTDFQARVDYTRAPEIGLKMLQQYINVTHASSGAYDVVVTYEPGGASQSVVTHSFTPATGFTERVGRFRAWIAGDLSRATITIRSSAATPVTITSLSQHGDIAPREYGT